MEKRATKQLIFLCLYLFMGVCHAKNLGVYGVTFEISEPDFKEFIYARLNQLQQNGELEKLNKRFLTNVKKHALRPTPVAGLTTTSNPQTFYYDPTYILKEDIKDAAGKVISAKGAIVNPFDVVTMHISGRVRDDKGAINTALLLSERMDFKLHRQLLIEDSSGDAGSGINGPICKQHFRPIMPKSRYRYQLTNTVPAADKCYQFGHDVVLWESGHKNPAGGNCFGFLVWKKRNCCFL